jgi:hypothetical protein
MKYRVKFGFKIKLPFNLFPNAATFILHLTKEQIVKLEENVANIQLLLQAAGKADLAANFFVDVPNVE